jgi:predicted NBD/HSP70 family sugar kinase/putative N-acetylmannosamine-6-phosphate epimerase
MTIQGGLIVSCQADPTDAFYGLMDRFARAAFAGGAKGIRANGPDDIRAIRSAVELPIIGIQKSIHSDGKILITPSFESAQALALAGATAIALDCTRRGQESGAFDRLRRIKTELKLPVMADIATVEEAIAAFEAGADFVLSTMRGYTADTSHVTHFDPRFIEQLVRAVGVPVIAEGRVDTPDFARQAMEAGAFAVVVGSTITRPHLVTRLFADAVKRKQQFILGIDLGGTNTKYGLVTTSGEMIWHDTAATPAQSGRKGLLDHLERIAHAGVARAAEAKQPVTSIGIATAGWVDPGTGRVVYATENLPGWTGTRIAETISAATSLPVFVENDANALAIGEKRFGAARDFDNFVCITLGTGVGGGCYVGGRLNHGGHFFANAFGHMTIQPGGRACSCGQTGCLEAYTNSAALLDYANGAYANTQLLIKAAEEGEPVATAALAEYSSYLAAGCALLIQLLDPEALIFAGGLAQNNSMLLTLLEEDLAGKVPVWQERKLKLLTSQLGYHAGVFGAAALAG